MRKFYLAGAILGFVLPYAYFVPFVIENGLNISLFINQLFQTHISAFFGLDVIASSVILWGFVFTEGRRLGMKHL